MPDERRHRGAHPEDAALFGADWLDPLRRAVADLSWLLSRGYAPVSALKVVGDRFNLSARQRTAVMRCACPDQGLAGRRSRETGLDSIAGRELLIDGYNVLTTVEAALAGGVLIVGRDGCWRDMASMHGTWRRVEETPPALARIGQVIQGRHGSAEVVWYLDAPVSNSGRLKGVIQGVAREHDWPWRVELVLDPDKQLAGAKDALVATADSVILDRCGRWVQLAREVV
ncbi:MAG TPA: DUF434 domain-containing protein, partial [Tepidisphaeraceae bacterium]